MKVKKISDKEYLIQLIPEDDIHENLNAFAKKYNITSGVINGIGAIKKRNSWIL
jgi:predicted DNA-binding protein with PD1-like motif